MLFSFGRTCTNGCRSVRWNAWANTCCVAGNVAVSAAIVPAATFTHFNATYVILRAAARRVRAPIRLGDTVHRWITLGDTWLLPRWLTLWTNRIPFQSSLPATWQGPFRDHRVRWTRPCPGHHSVDVAVADKLDAADSCFLFRLVDVNVSAGITNYCGIRCR